MYNLLWVVGRPQVQCPSCGHVVLTSVSREPSALTWLACLGLSLIGCVYGCCLLPFCLDDCKVRRASGRMMGMRVVMMVVVLLLLLLLVLLMVLTRHDAVPRLTCCCCFYAAVCLADGDVDAGCPPSLPPVGRAHVPGLSGHALHRLASISQTAAQESSHYCIGLGGQQQQQTDRQVWWEERGGLYRVKCIVSRRGGQAGRQTGRGPCVWGR